MKPTLLNPSSLNPSSLKLPLLLLLLSVLLFSCSKDKAGEDKTVNGIKVNTAVSNFNSFRTQGIPGYPAVAAVKWNDTLSLAAYNFAKAKTEDTNTPDNSYVLSNGQLILDFPDLLNFSGNANFALYYGFPADAEISTVIRAGFESDESTIVAGLMSASAKQFGMGQYGGKWYVIMSE